ncbi:unnamed protein product [Triticum turgidum subsp. durum]|uniref:Secreted protein n=1 Tax=Triticum turgidum subsp. durum TaxID=4567 RepID=A0A9R1A4R3_TRITD|nr:unnamed protein product [Triticum turgidum subsp. durum]
MQKPCFGHGIVGCSLLVGFAVAGHQAVNREMEVQELERSSTPSHKQAAGQWTMACGRCCAPSSSCPAQEAPAHDRAYASPTTQETADTAPVYQHRDQAALAQYLFFLC